MKCDCRSVPRILLAPLAAYKLDALTMMASGEISGLGSVRDVYDDGGCLSHIIVDDIRVPTQRASAASTEMDAEGVALVLSEYAADEVSPTDVRCWWHSHAAMDVFFSSTDEACIEGLQTEAALPLVSIVTNQAGKRLGRIDLFAPVRVALVGVPVDVLVPDAGLYDELSALVTARVRPFPPAFKTKGGGKKPAPEPPARELWWDDEGYDLLGGRLWAEEEVEP